jgi:N-acetylglutamate synthase
VSTEIREMTIADYDEVLALWQNIDGIGLDEDTDTRRDTAAYLERNPGLSFVAACDGKIVGAVICGHDGRRGYLNHLAVHPEYRSRGIGRELVDGCLSGLKALGITKCSIMVFGGNDQGLGFWRKCGWITRQDLLLMQMPIGCEHDCKSC